MVQKALIHGLPKKTLYAKGSFTTRKFSITVACLEAWLVVTSRMIVLSTEIASLKNSIKGELVICK